MNFGNLFVKLTFAIIFTFQLGAFAAPPKDLTEKDYWEKTSLSFDNLKIWVANDNCVSEVATYEGCFAAIKMMAVMGADKNELVPVGYYNAHPLEYKKLIEAKGSLVLAELNSDYIKTLKVPEYLKLRKTKIIAVSLEIQNGFKTKGIDFDYWFAKFRNSPKFSPHPQAYVASAFNAYLGVVYDPHTHLSSTEFIENQVTNANKVIYGIGATLTADLEGVKVVKVMKGSPAEKASVKDGDIIIAVDGLSTKGKEIDEVVSKIKGDENTLVVLNVKRRDDNAFDITVTRGKIEVKNVESEMLSLHGQQQAYIRLNDFMDRMACKSIQAAVETLEKQGAKGIILDLRGNPGGLLDQAVCIVGLFVGPGKTAVSIKDLQQGSSQPLITKNNKISDLPMVTLIDAGSASASEIVSGALQDLNRSWIMGQRSYGKGSAQEGLPVYIQAGNIAIPPASMTRFAPRSEITVFLTNKRFYQPSGSTNQVVGIIPDIDVTLRINSKDYENMAVREEDGYSNALPALNLARKQSRPGELATLQKCLSQMPAPSPSAEDFQLYYAEEAITCSMTN